MIIVSQDKRSIVNFEKVKIININRSDLREISAYFNCDEEKSNDNVLLGTYETEERAREVFGEIINMYKATESFTAAANRISDNVSALAIKKGFAYYMPIE